MTAGLEANPDARTDALAALAAVGGRELAAMAGAIAAARHRRIPVLLDGFIATAAAAVLDRTVAGALDHCVAGHLSDEAAHGRLLRALGKEPLLALGLRLGEASGATLAIPIRARRTGLSFRHGDFCRGRGGGRLTPEKVSTCGHRVKVVI